MITGQNYDKEVKITVHYTGAEWCVILELTDDTPYLTGEAALKVAHALIEAGEEVIKKPIK